MIIIPARLNSTRLHQKLLLKKEGKTLLQHTIDQARKTNLPIIVLADSQIIIDTIEKTDNVKAYLTPEAKSGTERIIKFINEHNINESFINWQADEPTLNPAVAMTLYEKLKTTTNDVETAITSLTDYKSINNYNTVKCVQHDNKAIYFSREPVPHGGPYYKHIGIYGFKKPTDKLLTNAIANEKLEQLGWMATGLSIGVTIVDDNNTSIDDDTSYIAWIK